ncbi:MAG: MbtH family NRPS accessory protein [Flavobacteriales bacterium]|nr:MbtH family NRPS accessory protein [Flavobacteriales bacterium]
MKNVIKEAKEQKLLDYIVKNHEGQYSIWAGNKSVPEGWLAVGKSQSKEACLAYIDKVWVDMRPLSLRSMTC